MTCSNYVVRIPGMIPFLKQSKLMDCWAVVSTFLISWREQINYDINTIMERLGSDYIQLYLNDSGLATDRVDNWLYVSGFIEEEPQWYSISKIADMIREFGPLVFTNVQDKDHLFLFRSKIVIGILTIDDKNCENDILLPDLNCYEVIYMDTITGKESALPFDQFCKVSGDIYSKGSLFTRVIHLPTQIMFINNLRK